MKKRIITLLMACIVLSNSIPSYAEDLKTPDTLIVDGKLIYRNSDFSSELNANELDFGGLSAFLDKDSARPNVILGYDIDASSARLSNWRIVDKYAYIYGTTVYLPSGTSAVYTGERKVSKSATTEWSLSASGEVEAAAPGIKSKISASSGYKSTNTATLEKKESWAVTLSNAGKYHIDWYMRGHKYDVICNAITISTGIEDGKPVDRNVGSVTFPTTEIAIDVNKIG